MTSPHFPTHIVTLLWTATFYTVRKWQSLFSHSNIYIPHVVSHTSPPYLVILLMVETMLYSVALSSPVLISSRKRALRSPRYL